MSEAPRPRGPRRRRPSAGRIAFQLAVGALAVWAITHPRSPLVPPTAVAPIEDDSSATDSAAVVAPPAPAALPRPAAPIRTPTLPRLRDARLFRSVETRARAGERIAVTITAYCLQGRTRRGNPVREGIVAADPRLFPLGRTLELWIGRRAAGPHLIDDTGSAIKGAKLDLWMADCSAARRFGRRRGYAQLVPRPRP
ncbi:MAG: 3D domain-containing protein [Gemmatimonadaceae bacterium]|nr:3D domain-containing protein [Gemmatimonadaceae bacterium]